MVEHADLQRPHFVIIGAAKAGTTTLFSYLCRHPGVYGSIIKEPSFFSYWPDRELHKGFLDLVKLGRLQGMVLDDPGTWRGNPSIAWRQFLPAYSALFANAQAHQVCGEATTNYTRFPQYPDVPARMAQVIPDAKLIYVLRNPVDRAYSHYVHRHSKELYQGRPFQLTFEEFIAQEPVCIDSSRYMLQIQRFLEFYPRHAFFFLTLDELKENPQRSLQQVFRFLGVDESVDIFEQTPEKSQNVERDFRETVIRNTLTQPWKGSSTLRAAWRILPKGIRNQIIVMMSNSRYGQRIRNEYTPRPMRATTRDELSQLFRGEIQSLSEFLGRDLTSWVSSAC